jgi:crossover junction endodeoxyribonuclease RuvC
MRIIGIDPGKSGGIAYSVDGVFQAWPMPRTEHDIARLLNDMHFKGETHCFIEKVHAMPGQGVTSMFTFGRGYGFLRGCLTALKVPFEEVPPKTWQKALGCLSKGDKHVPRGKAQQLFPGHKITLKTADAYLICEYGRRQLERKSYQRKESKP